MSYHHDEHSDMHALLGLGLLGAVLLLPSNLLLRLLRRLAILAGVCIAVIAVTIGAYAVFTPAMPLCPVGPHPASTIVNPCKERPNQSKPSRPCTNGNPYESLIPGANCY